jgi:homoserine O-acetyltransferase/O-succinyltransferase
MVLSPYQWHKTGPSVASSDEYVDQWVKDQLEVQDANDCMYAFAASADYDPVPLFPEVKLQLFAINFADDQINSAELKILEDEIVKVPKGKYVVVPASEKTFGHSNQGHPEIWEG